MKQLILLVFTIFLFSACSVRYDNIDFNKKTQLTKNMKELSLLIQSLSNKIEKKEADDLSFEAINYSKYLANEYRVVPPALFHNSLINMGFKKRGLCYHYAEDLLNYLNSKNYKSLFFKTIVANKKEYFEHTSILLMTNNVDFENSIVLDAWRGYGKLFFSILKEDKKYQWELKDE